MQREISVSLFHLSMLKIKKTIYVLQGPKYPYLGPLQKLVFRVSFLFPYWKPGFYL